MNDYIIETHNLTKKYGSQTSVSHLNIHVKKGRIYGLLGRNGAGKTTTMRMLLGLTAPTSGEVTIFGKPFQGNEKNILPHIGCLIESPGFYPNLTGTENLKIFAELRGLRSPKYIKNALLGFFLYLTMLPIIVLTSRYKGSFLVGVIVAFVYGFIGMFANGTLQSIYPVSAALGLINYRAGAEGVMWNKGLCFISILIMCAIGIALMFVKQKPEKREAKKTQHTAPKKGW